MLRFHIRQNLRSAVFLAVLAVVVALPATLWRANRVGLPDSWRALIQRELANQDVHMVIGSIRYLPFRGIEAADVRVFADPEHEYELSRFGRIVLDLDKTKLARGEVRLNKIALANADVLLPVDTDDPESEALELTGVSGTVLMLGGRVFELRDVRGRVGGIDMVLDARLLSYRSTGHGGLPVEQDKRRGKRREFIAHICRELERWSYPEDQPPRVRVRVDGDLADRASFTSTFVVEAPSMALGGQPLTDVRIEGHLLGEVLVIDDLSAADGQGRLAGRADYDLLTHSGRFDLESTLDLVLLARDWFGLEMPHDVGIAGGQSLAAAGDFRIGENGAPPEVRATGRAACELLSVRGVRFDSAESAFSWRDGDLFLRDARVTRADGEAFGKVLVRWPDVRMAMETNLPIPLYKPFFKGMPLEQVIDSFTVDASTRAWVRLDGGFEVGSRKSWHYTGRGRVERARYNGVPVVSAAAVFDVNHDRLDFRNCELVLDTRRYPQRTAHGGPAQVSGRADLIHFDNLEKIVRVENVRGDLWVPPVLRLFNAGLADNLEAYRFHRPPSVRASGSVALMPTGRTRLDIDFETPAPAATEVLGEAITFDRAAGRVLLRGDRVEVRDLALQGFNGPVNATFLHEKNTLNAEITWTRLNLPALAAAYDVEMQGGGTTTGRVEFSQQDGRIETLKGDGNIGFEDAHLFAVPMFGPLSPLISAVLNDRRAGYERAKDAFCTFDIEGGVLRSRDFTTSTNSLVFTGDGTLDFNTSSVDMTMRMNARGLLGIITLPLRPFYGLFQFRGTGPMRDPKWENVRFTSPPDDQRDRLMAPPRAIIVREP